MWQLFLRLCVSVPFMRSQYLNYSNRMQQLRGAKIKTPLPTAFSTKESCFSDNALADSSQQDNELMLKLLSYLQAVEALMQPGDKQLVQPYYDKSWVPNGFKIDGYPGPQINEQLRLLIHDGFIEGEELPIGIFFDRLTQNGIAFLKKTMP